MARDIELKLKITADGKVAVDQLDSISDATARVGTETEESAGAAKQFVDQYSDIGKIAVGMNQLAELASKALGPLKNIANLAGDYTDLASRVELAVGSQEAAAEVLDEIGRIARESHAPLETVGNLYVKLANATKDTGATQQETLRFTQALSDALLVSGAGAAEAAGAIRQLGQGLASGALRGDEFNSVAEQMPILLEAIAKQTGVARGELREYAAQGGITADIVREAVAGMADDWREAAEQMPVTIERSLTDLESAFTEYVGQSELVSGSTESIARAIGYLGESLQTIGPIVESAVVGIGGLTIAKTIGPSLNQMGAGAVSAAKALPALVTAEKRAAAAALETVTARAAATAALVAEKEAYLANLAEMRIYGPLRARTEAEVAAAKTANKAATDQLVIAEARLQTATTASIVKQSAMAVSATATARALTALKSVYAGLGGPAGIILLGVTALGAWSVGAKEAAEETDDLTERLEKLRSGMNKLTTEQIERKITALRQELVDLKEESKPGLFNFDPNGRVELIQQMGEINRTINALTARLPEVKAVTDELAQAELELIPAAVELVKHFGELEGKGKTAAASIGELAKSLDLSTAETTAATAAALGEAIRHLGEKSKVTAQDIQEGLGPALRKLSGEDLLGFATAWEEVVEAMGGEEIAQVAEVMESVLGAALARLKLDLEDVRTGTTAVGRDMVAAFEAVAISAQGETDVIAAAWQSMLSKLGSSQDIQGARDALTQLGEDGRIAMDQLVEMTEELDRAQRRLSATTGEVADAFKRLGITSSAELTAAAEQAYADFETIRDSGVATAEDITAAWEVYAQKAIESGDAVEQSQARQEAAARGMLEEYEALVKTVTGVADQSERSATASEKDADSRERGAEAEEKKADAVARRKTSETTGTTLSEAQARTQQSLGRQYGTEAAKAFASEIQSIRDIYGLSLSPAAETSRARAAVEAQYKTEPATTERTTGATRNVTVQLKSATGDVVEIEGDEAVTLGDLEQAQRTAA